MTTLAAALIGVSAVIIFLLGAAHLTFTFHGPKLQPRDPALRQQMQNVSPVITRETTIWRAWIGFNASHSLGALLFGAVYGYLALWQAPLLFQSLFLLALGWLTLAAYLALAWRYWFKIPQRGIGLALTLYTAGLVAHAL